MRLDVRILINAVFIDKDTNEKYLFNDQNIINQCFDKEKFFNLLKEKMKDIAQLTYEH